MSEIRKYNSPEAFKQALEVRLRQSTNLNRARQLLVMERFYGRIAAVMGDAVVVKGGLVLERRLDQARTTKDLDLRLSGDPEALLATLQQAGQLDFEDFLTFTVEPDPRHPTIDGEALVYEGRRYRVTPFLAGKIYGAAFGVDAGFGDPMWGAIDLFDGADTLEVRRGRHGGYILATHISPKSYMLTRCRGSARIRA